MKKSSRFKKFLLSFKCAIEGLTAAIRRERSMRIHVVVATIVIICGIIFKVSTLEWFFLLLLIGTVISAELLNTAIESLIDISVKEFNHKAKFVKDVFAASVLVFSVTAVVVGLIIFLPKIIDLVR